MKQKMKMVLMTTFLALLMAALPFAAGAAEENKAPDGAKPASEASAARPAPPEDQVTGEVAASILSAYIWRGQELSRHSIVIQPQATVAYRGFSVNVWGNLDTRPYDAAEGKHASNFTETDLTLCYSRKFGILSAGAGYIYYGLHGAAAGGADFPDAQEIFLTAGLDTLLAPTLTIYKEIDHYHQWYALLGISHTFALHEKVGLKLAGSISYLKSEDAAAYPKFDAASTATSDKFNNFHDATVSVALPVAVTKNITVTPLVTYVFPLSDDAKYEMRARGLQGAVNPSDRDSAYLYGGLTLSFTF